MTHDLDQRPLPAPLPYSSQAGRGEIPPHDPTTAWDRDHYDPRAARMPEDEVTLWACAAFVFGFMVLMSLIALSGGL